MINGTTGVSVPVRPDSEAWITAWVRPLPTSSSTFVPAPARASWTTLTSCLARGPRSQTPCAVQPAAARSKTSTRPGRLQEPATSGSPDDVTAAAVSLIRPQERPAGVAARARRVTSDVQPESAATRLLRSVGRDRQQAAAGQRGERGRGGHQTSGEQAL